MVKKYFLFLVYSPVFVALVAILNCMESFTILGFTNTVSLFIAFIFLSTLGSYSFHWCLTKPNDSNAEKENWSISNKKLLLLLGISASLLSIVLFVYFPKNLQIKILPLIFFTFLYSAPKIPYKPFSFLQKMVIGKTIYLSFFWTYATVYLPFAYCQQPVNYGFFVYKFLFVLLICILFDHKDFVQDSKNGITYFINYANPTFIKVLFYLLVTIQIGLGIFLFSPVDFAIEMTPTLLLILLWKKSLQTKKDWWYYFVLDGLLACSGFLFLILKLFHLSPTFHT